MRLIAEISRSSDGRLEGTIQSDPSATPVPFSGVLELLRVLEDEVPAAVESDAGSAAPS
jgi:hypothetical protein